MYLSHPAVTRLLHPNATTPGVRVLAFPFAGSNASIFFPWKTLLSKDVELLAYTPPGRGGRIMEDSCTQMRHLVTDAWSHLSPYLDKPYIVFGHSLGALVGFEFLQLARAAGRPLPRHFIPSARKAPHLASMENWTAMDDTEFVAALKELGGLHPDIASNPELLSLLLPNLRADVAIVEHYQPKASEAALAIPTTVYGGTQDSRIPHADLLPWQNYFQPEIRIRMLDAGHFYLSKHAPTLTSDINHLAAMMSTETPSLSW